VCDFNWKKLDMQVMMFSLILLLQLSGPFNYGIDLKYWMRSSSLLSENYKVLNEGR